MRSVVISRAGPPDVLEIEDRPIPEPGPSEIRVRIRASALNRADLVQRRGRYPAPPGAPADVPGLEYAGEVDAIGPGAGLWSVGSRVMGIVGGGGHAEYVCVHEREAVHVPPNLSWDEAAAVPEVFFTAYDAVFRQLEMQVGERLLVHAVGSGVGTAAVQLARVAGIATLGTSRTPGKLARAATLGLGTGIDSQEPGWGDRVMDATGGQGVVAVLDLVGGPFLAENLRVLSDRGRIVVVGVMGGASSELDLGLLLRKRARIIGTVLRSRPVEEKIQLAREFSEIVVPLLASGQIVPVIERTFPFDRIRDAHRLLESNRTFGKIVLRW